MVLRATTQAKKRFPAPLHHHQSELFLQGGQESGSWGFMLVMPNCCPINLHPIHEAGHRFSSPGPWRLAQPVLTVRSDSCSWLIGVGLMRCSAVAHPPRFSRNRDLWDAFLLTTVVKCGLWWQLRWLLRVINRAREIAGWGTARISLHLTNTCLKTIESLKIYILKAQASKRYKSALQFFILLLSGRSNLWCSRCYHTNVTIFLLYIYIYIYIYCADTQSYFLIYHNIFNKLLWYQ